jgi:serine/threonine protein kinase
VSNLRDLKPENLVFETPDIASSIKVIDFDTSRIFDSCKEMWEVAGTVIELLICRFLIWLPKSSKDHIQRSVICGVVVL